MTDQEWKERRAREREREDDRALIIKTYVKAMIECDDLRVRAEACAMLWRMGAVTAEMGVGLMRARSN